tara:strand:+ start:131 stop:337 length:207 start_codon:yes stop_codon:yes gene_type:complete
VGGALPFGEARVEQVVAVGQRSGLEDPKETISEWAVQRVVQDVVSEQADEQTQEVGGDVGALAASGVA